MLVIALFIVGLNDLIHIEASTNCDFTVSSDGTTYTLDLSKFSSNEYKANSDGFSMKYFPCQAGTSCSFDSTNAMIIAKSSNQCLTLAYSEPSPSNTHFSYKSPAIYDSEINAVRLTYVAYNNYTYVYWQCVNDKSFNGTNAVMTATIETNIYNITMKSYDICSQIPTMAPTLAPSRNPTMIPTDAPTDSPTESPTASPTHSPTNSPSQNPIHNPTKYPTSMPSNSPTDSPTDSPTNSPIYVNISTESPSLAPTLTQAIVVKTSHESIFEKMENEIVNHEYYAITFIALIIGSICYCLSNCCVWINEDNVKSMKKRKKSNLKCCKKLTRYFCGFQLPSGNHKLIFSIMFTILDVYSDIQFIHYLMFVLNSKLEAWIVIIGIVLSILLNFYFLIRIFKYEIKFETHSPHQNDNEITETPSSTLIKLRNNPNRKMSQFSKELQPFIAWYWKYTYIATLTCLLSVFDLRLLKLVDSNLFNLKAFNAPIRLVSSIRISMYCLASVIVENIPQLIIQIHIFLSNKHDSNDNDSLTIFSFTIAFVDVFIAIVRSFVWWLIVRIGYNSDEERKETIWNQNEPAANKFIIFNEDPNDIAQTLYESQSQDLSEHASLSSLNTNEAIDGSIDSQ